MRVLFFVVLCVSLCALVARVDAQTCTLGYTGPDGGPCVACATATYKTSVGSTACTVCHARSTSPEASTSSATFLCNAGLYLLRSGVGCIGCQPYKYKDVIGNQACSSCPANTYPEDIPNVSWDTPRLSSSCMACPSGSFCTDPDCWGMNYCVCDVGHYGPNTGRPPCLLCGAGSYMDDTGHLGCYWCEKGYYQDQIGATSCKQCPSDMSSVQLKSTGAVKCDCRPGSVFDNATNACLCNAGLYLFNSGVGCVGCVYNTYKDVIGNQASTACPANTYPQVFENPDGYTPRLSSSCITCPSGSSCPNYYCGHIRDCRYDPDHSGHRESVCLPCEAGQYAAGVGSEVCNYCTPGNYQDQTGATVCKQCPPDTSSDYTATGGPVTCTGCPASTEFDPVTNASVSCANNTVWSGTMSSCVCAAGFGQELEPV
jgi:hypothetical protein